MNLALLLPAGLTALAALLLPLLIHLVRRNEQRLTDFAALRWLSPKPQPRRKHRFDERLLLLLRLLLLAALALLLARPVLFGRPDLTLWIVAAPGVAAGTLRDAEGPADAQRRWLAPGFPAIDEAAPTGRQPIASLLRELDATLPAGAPLTVLVPTVIDGADAQRPKLGREIDWRIVPAAQAPEAKPAEPPAVPAMAVRYAPQRAPGLRYLRAAGAAWQASASATPARAKAATSSVTTAEAMQPLDAQARNLVWLAPGPLPEHVRDWISAGGRALLDAGSAAPELADATPLWRDADGEALVRGTAFGRGRIMQFTRELSPKAMPQLLEADFPERLRALFADAAPAPSRVAASAYAPTSGATPWPESPRPLSPWLIALITALFAVERWLAAGPRRGAAA